MTVAIGKAVLYQMLGVQPAHYEAAITLPEQCKTCPWAEAAIKNPSPAMLNKLQMQCQGCTNCKSQTSELVSKYINEKNKYGSNSKVCRNAILLFASLHTYNPSQAGYVHRVSIAAIAKSLDISERTVRNCLKQLSDAGYLFVDYTADGYFNAIIIDYAKYFVKASEGGRGYIKLSESVLCELKNVHSIVAFRLIFRQLLESDYSTSSTKTYRELRRSLPEYCKRNIIIEKLSECANTIFSIITDIHSVSFKLKPECNTTLLSQVEEKENSIFFSKLLDKLDDFVFSSTPLDPEFIPNDLHRFFFDEVGNAVKEPVLFQRSNAEALTTDLAKLASKYTRNVVANALADTYRLQMCKQHSLIKNIGTYVLGVIQSYGSVRSAA